MPDDIDDLVRDFERDGFVSGGVLCTADDIRALCEDLERHRASLDAPTPTTPELQHADFSDRAGQSHQCIAGLFHVSGRFRRLAQHSRMNAIAARLMQSETTQLWVDVVHHKPRGVGAPRSWHQDASYHKPVEPADRMVSVWIALDDVDEANGCMWMVPGSHRWGNREPYLWRFRDATEPADFRSITASPSITGDVVPWRSAVPRRARAGEVLFHHSLTWHGSSANRSSRPRRGYSLFLMPDVARATGFPDGRLKLAKGTLLRDAGDEFPILYREVRHAPAS